MPDRRHDERMDAETVRQFAAATLGMELSEAEGGALAGLLEGAARGAAAFPHDRLKGLEPPLVPAPGPAEGRA
jgi:hypothetical protein